jgi:group II intron reverse transcriptase/maturase
LSGEILLPQIQRIANEAKMEPQRVFTNLAHLIDYHLLHEAYLQTRKDGAAGVDQVTGHKYGENLHYNLNDLHQRLKEKRYEAKPVKRVYVDKDSGEKRPLGIPAFEDKIVQRAVMMLLEAIYEQDFLPCSYGFRPNCNPHKALHDLREECMQGWVNWIIDADIKGFFDQIDRGILRELLHKRVKDGGIDRLIGKWFGAGILDGDQLTHPKLGTPQGSVISPLYGNIYLHYVLDEWIEQVVKPRMRGRIFLIRYADDFVIGCELEDDAKRLLEVLGKRLNKYGLELHPNKTRMVRFYRQNRYTEAKPENGVFDFLGFTHYWGKSYRGFWVVKRSTKKKSHKKALKSIWNWCKTHRHDDRHTQHNMLSRKLEGLYQYYGIRGNFESLRRLYVETLQTWKYWLGRCSQKSRMTWELYRKLLESYPLPEPRIVHWLI